MESKPDLSNASRIATAATLSQFLGLPLTAAGAALALEVSRRVGELPPDSRLIVPLAAAGAAAAIQITADYATARRTGQFGNYAAQIYLAKHPGKFMRAAIIGNLYGTLTNPVNYSGVVNFATTGSLDTIACPLAANGLNGIAACIGTNVLINCGLAQTFNQKVANPLLSQINILGQKAGVPQKIELIKSKINLHRFGREIEGQRQLLAQIAQTESYADY